MVIILNLSCSFVINHAFSRADFSPNACHFWGGKSGVFIVKTLNFSSIT